MGELLSLQFLLSAARLVSISPKDTLLLIFIPFSLLSLYLSPHLSLTIPLFSLSQNRLSHSRI